MSKAITVIEGRREECEAEVSSRSILYLPFEVPEGVTQINIRKELGFGDSDRRGTVDHGLFDPRGIGFGGPGYRGWQGGTSEDIVFTGDVSTSGSWFIPGPITPGTWHLAQWFLLSPPSGMDYKYTITLSFDGPTPPANTPDVPAYDPGIISPTPGWYPGQLHTHSLHSDGGHALNDLVAHCKSAGLSFLACTDHNNPRSHWHYAEAARENPDMLLIFGQEITSPGGHAGVLGTKPRFWFDFRIDAGDGQLPKLVEMAHGQGATFVVNHPYAGCTTCEWQYPQNEWKDADAIEVWNGRWTPDDRMAVDLWDSMLRSGRKIAAVGGSDYHRGNDALIPTIWAYTKNLSEAAVMAAIRSGRSFLSDGPKVFLKSGNALPADTVTLAGDEMIDMNVQVIDGKGMALRLISSDSQVEFAINADDMIINHRFALDGKRGYVRAELVRSHGSVAVITNPIYVERPSDTAFQ